MGITASLFFSSNDTSKETLYRTVTPSDEQYKEQEERWDLLADHLLGDLNAMTGYPIKTWLQGSYKYGTQIRPVKMGEEFDIDLGVYFVWPGAPDNEDENMSPLELKNFVQNSLKKYASLNPEEVIEVTNPKPRCCRVRFQGNFHIDVPTYHLDDTADKRTLATQDDQWEESDPKAFYAWFKTLFDDNKRAKLRRHIRYLKCWAGLKFDEDQFRPSSVLLTVLAAEAFDKLSDDQLSSDDNAFHFMASKILERLQRDTVVKNPANQLEKLTERISKDDLVSLTRGLVELESIALRATQASDLITASTIWAEAFGHFFPMPSEAEISEQTKNAPKNALAVVRFNPQIKVTATSKDNPLKGWTGNNKIGPIAKNCSIVFTVENYSSLPSGAVVTWTVRNTGGEAEYVNDMGHGKRTGAICHEHSAYNGRHYMDCTVTLNRQVIGFQRVPVEISGNKMPRRNLLQRPAYTKLLGRR